jgi:hypothetical protein
LDEYLRRGDLCSGEQYFESPLSQLWAAG